MLAMRNRLNEYKRNRTNYCRCVTSVSLVVAFKEPVRRAQYALIEFAADDTVHVKTRANELLAADFVGPCHDDAEHSRALDVRRNLPRVHSIGALERVVILVMRRHDPVITIHGRQQHPVAQARAGHVAVPQCVMPRRDLNALRKLYLKPSLCTAPDGKIACRDKQE